MFTQYFDVWKTARTVIAGLLALFTPLSVQAAVISFSGDLDVVIVDDGGVYSGTPLGTTFTGTIDDVTANGVISDGATATPFSCCIAADGLDIEHDVMLDAADADFLNALAGSMLFSAGDLIDTLNIEGDAATANGGRIEIGLSFILAPTAFDDNDPANYPFDVNDLIMTLFFILEEDANDDIDNDIYEAIGLVDILTLPAMMQDPAQIPLPGAFWLFASSIGAFAAARKNRRRKNPGL